MTGAIRARVNGEDAELAFGATVEDVVRLVSSLSPAVASARELQRGRAVALNGEVVPGSAWVSTRIEAGDEVEVLGVAAGG